jgi:hypothetical protein
VVKATANTNQVVVALSGGEVVYFQLDSMTGQLEEHPERLGVPSNVACIAIGPVPEGRVGASLLAIGCDDRTVRIVSLDPADCLQQRSVQVGLFCLDHLLAGRKYSSHMFCIGRRGSGALPPDGGDGGGNGGGAGGGGWGSGGVHE